MLSLRTTLLTTTLLLIVSSIGAGTASAPRHTEEPAEIPDLESLRGLVGMEVLVEPLSVEIEQAGLQTLKLQSDVKQRLQKAGVKVLTERERLATPTAAMLVIRVETLHDRIGRYFYATDLLLTQQVRLEGHGESELPAVTWMKLGTMSTVADDNLKHLEDQVLRKVDQFIKDYLAVNPDRRVSNQRQKQ